MNPCNHRKKLRIEDQEIIYSPCDVAIENCWKETFAVCNECFKGVERSAVGIS